MHKLELAVLDLIKCDNYLQDLDMDIKNIFQLYFYSPPEEEKCTKLLKDEFRQFGRLKNIRSITSRHRALNLLKNDFKVLVYESKSKSYENGKCQRRLKAI